MERSLKMWHFPEVSGFRQKKSVQENQVATDLYGMMLMSKTGSVNF